MQNHHGSLLVVDDNEINRDLLSRLLTSKGYSVSAVESGVGALDWLAQHPVDVLLLDVQMPGMNGLEVLQVLRKTHSPARLPIIMVTGNSGTDDVVHALTLGANDYVTKPIDFPVALARIHTQLSLKRAEDALRESEERYALAARGANDGLWDWNLRTDEIYFSSRWKGMLGWEDQDIGNSKEEWLHRVHPEDIDHMMSEISTHLDGLTPHFENEHRILHRDGTYRWMLGRGMAVRNSSDKPYRLAGSLTDITRGKVADALTGLPNRVLFMDRLGRCLERSKRNQDHRFAVIFLDLDGFKLINDSLGHLVGDQLLVALARRLEASLRAADTLSRLSSSHTVARMGGDEFTILLDDIRQPANASRVAERIGKEITQPFSLGGQEVFTTASMGIALSSPVYERPEEVLRDADTAMYRAKTLGKARWEIFDAEMRASAVARLQLETELRRAVENQEFENHYQAIISLDTSRIRGFEVLIRWRHPTRGLVGPEEFISVAEETGLIIPMGQWQLWEACRQVQNWQAGFHKDPPLSISVNLCGKHFMQLDLVEQYIQVLTETGLPASSLTLEITESAVMPDPEAAIDLMLRLKELGITLAMDDFGTGYSSLSYLHRFPLDMLKIDRSFVSRMGADNENMEIVRTIVSMAQTLGLKVVAEGVETAKQLALLRELGCEYAQGFYMARPVDAEAAGDLIAADPRW